MKKGLFHYCASYYDDDEIGVVYPTYASGSVVCEIPTSPEGLKELSGKIRESHTSAKNFCVVSLTLINTIEQEA